MADRNENPSKTDQSKKQETKPLDPGQEFTVFKDTLINVLLLDTEKPKPLKPKEERYYWSWNA